MKKNLKNLRLHTDFIILFLNLTLLKTLTSLSFTECIMACGVEQWIQYFFFQKKANICTIDKLLLVYSFEIPPLLNSKFLHKTLSVYMFCLVMYLLMPTSHPLIIFMLF